MALRNPGACAHASGRPGNREAWYYHSGGNSTGHREGVVGGSRMGATAPNQERGSPIISHQNGTSPLGFGRSSLPPTTTRRDCKSRAGLRLKCAHPCRGRSWQRKTSLGSGGQDGRHAPRKTTPKDPSELRGCPTIPKSCRKVSPSAEIPAEVGQVVTDVGRIWSNLG